MKIYLFLCLVIVPFISKTQPVSSPADTSLVITQLTGDFYIYTTYQQYGDSNFPSNSMYVVTDAGVIMIDTPWDTTRFQPLLDSIEVKHHKKVVLCVATHFHSDRTGGFDFLRAKGIATWSSKKTYDLCKEHNEKQAQYFFNNDTTFTIGQYSFRTFYPGQGHTKDNIVIWFGQSNVLYGGCFIKSREAGNLGNIADANVQEWSGSINKVIKEFPRPDYIIPGHQSWTSRRALRHTLFLINRYKSLFRTT